jgi:dolichol-phosphate mannosyltransferase
MSGTSTRLRTFEQGWCPMEGEKVVIRKVEPWKWEFRGIQYQAGDSLSCPIPLRSSECVVVVPTYNERENIASLISALQSLSEPVDILVVDDNSPDGTAEIVRNRIRQREGIYLLVRPGKTGLGSAYKAGFAFALRHGWKYIAQMDADFSHNPKDVLRLLQACRTGADVAIGSRYVKGGRIEGWPLKRWIISRGANLLAQVMLRSRIRDLTGGFKCFTRQAMEQIDLNRVASEGYIFQVEMNHRARDQGLTIRQVPICFTDRKRGLSKMGTQEARDGIRQLWRMMQRNHKRVVLQTQVEYA